MAPKAAVQQKKVEKATDAKKKVVKGQHLHRKKKIRYNQSEIMIPLKN